MTGLGTVSTRTSPAPYISVALMTQVNASRAEVRSPCLSGYWQCLPQFASARASAAVVAARLESRRSEASDGEAGSVP